MLTTRGETYGGESADTVGTRRYAYLDAPADHDGVLADIPIDWSADDHEADPGFAVERTSMWRWRRRAAMVASIAGIALAVVTFSLAPPISEYTLISDGGPKSAVEDDNNASQRSDGADPLSLTAASSGHEFRLFASTGVGDESDLDGASDTTTTTAPTTTAIPWAEPVIEPESQWVDAGNGVRVPDVLLRIRFCESTNNYRAAHTHSSARGAYQFLSGSWSWYGHAARYGVATADLATPAQQDEAAVITLRRDGARPWKASFGCWGSDSISPSYATARPATTTTTSAPSSTTSSSTDDTTTTTGASTTASTQESTSTTGSTTTTAPSSTTTDTSGAAAPTETTNG